MAIEFEIRGSLVRVKADRTATQEELLDAIERTVQHADFRPRSAVLADVRAIPDAPTNAELVATGQLLAEHGARHFSQVAFLATGPLQFGLTRVLGSYASAGGLEVQVFEGEEDALAWLSRFR